MVEVADILWNSAWTNRCGKCIPCRVGTVQMHDILNAITQWQRPRGRPDAAEELCDRGARHSLCGLGQNAPNPVISTLHYFL